MANVIRSNSSPKRSGALGTNSHDKNEFFIPLQLSYSFKAVKKPVGELIPARNDLYHSTLPTKSNLAGIDGDNNFTSQYTSSFPVPGDSAGDRHISQIEPRSIFSVEQSSGAQSSDNLRLASSSFYNVFQSSKPAWTLPPRTSLNETLVQPSTFPPRPVVNSGIVHGLSDNSAYTNGGFEASSVVSESREPPSLGLPPGARAVRKRGEKVTHARRSPVVSDSNANIISPEETSASTLEVDGANEQSLNREIAKVLSPKEGHKASVILAPSVSSSSSPDAQPSQKEINNNGNENNNYNSKVRGPLIKDNGTAVLGVERFFSSSNSSVLSEKSQISSGKKSFEKSGRRTTHDGLNGSEQLSKTDTSSLKSSHEDVRMKHSSPFRLNGKQSDSSVVKDRSQHNNEEASLTSRSGTIIGPHDASSRQESRMSPEKGPAANSKSTVPSPSSFLREGSKHLSDSTATIESMSGKGFHSEENATKVAKENLPQTGLKEIDIQRSKVDSKPKKSSHPLSLNDSTSSAEKRSSKSLANDTNKELTDIVSKASTAKKSNHSSSSLTKSIHSPSVDESSAAAAKKLKKRSSLTTTSGEKHREGNIQIRAVVDSAPASSASSSKPSSGSTVVRRDSTSLSDKLKAVSHKNDLSLAGDKQKPLKLIKDSSKRPSTDKDSNGPSKRPTLNKQPSQLHRPGHTRNPLFDANWRAPPSANDSRDGRERSAEKPLASSSSKEELRTTSSNAYTRPILHQSSSFSRSETLKNLPKTLSTYQLPFLAPSESLEKASWVKSQPAQTSVATQSRQPTTPINALKPGLTNKADSAIESVATNDKSLRPSDDKRKMANQSRSQSENRDPKVSAEGPIWKDVAAQGHQAQIAPENDRKKEEADGKVRNISGQHEQRKSIPASGRPYDLKTGESSKRHKVMNFYKCGWDQCTAELHSLETLRHHAYKSHVLKKPADVVLCKWEGCHTMLPKTMKNGWLHHFAEHGKVIASSGKGYVESLDQSLFHPPRILSSGDLEDIYYTPEAKPAPPNYTFPANVLETNGDDAVSKIENSIDDTPDNVANREQMIAVFAAMGAGWDNEEYEDDPCPMFRTNNEAPVLSGDGKTRWWHVQLAQK